MKRQRDLRRWVVRIGATMIWPYRTYTQAVALAREHGGGATCVYLLDPPELRGDMRPANVCEHGDHPAPEGQRFCSEACQECEHTALMEEDEPCAGVCGFGAGVG